MDRMAERPRESKELGAIESVRIGNYPDEPFGVHFRFWQPGGNVGTSWYGPDTLLKLHGLMQDAAVTNFVNLRGVPVKLTFDCLRLMTFRVLTEVIIK